MLSNSVLQALGDPWPDNELGTACGSVLDTQELFQEQETATLSEFAPWEETWEHFSSIGSTASVFQSCLFFFLPLPAQLWIQ